MEHPPIAHPSRDSVSVFEAMGTAWKQGTVGDFLKVTLLLFIPIIGPIIIAGWTAEITKRTALGVPNVIPPLKLNAFGYWIKRGIPPYISTLVYTTVASFLSSFFMIPVYIGLMLAGEFLGSGPVLAAFMFFGFGFMMLNAVLLGVLGNAASTVADMSGDLNQAFNLKVVKQYVYGTVGSSLKVSIVLGLTFALLAIPAMLLFVVPYLVLLGFAFTANGVARGLIHQRYVGKGFAPIGVEPPEFMPGETPWQQPHLLVDDAGTSHPSWAPVQVAAMPVGQPYGGYPGHSGDPGGQAGGLPPQYGAPGYPQAPYSQPGYPQAPYSQPGYPQAPYSQPGYPQSEPHVRQHPGPGHASPPQSEYPPDWGSSPAQPPSDYGTGD